MKKTKKSKRQVLDLTDKLERAEDLVIEQARYIAKYICNAHICVQLEPAMQKLVARVHKLNKASEDFHGAA